MLEYERIDVRAYISLFIAPITMSAKCKFDRDLSTQMHSLPEIVYTEIPYHTNLVFGEGLNEHRDNRAEVWYDLSACFFFQCRKCTAGRLLHTLVVVENATQ